MQLRLNLINNGQELQQSDINTLAQVASAADDQVLAELLRLPPGTGSAPYAKYIAPYTYTGEYGNATVQSGGTGTGQVQINPFRAIVGSRTSTAASAPLSWTDIRTAVFTGPTSSLSILHGPFSPNGSGSTRFDLVYAAVAIDGPVTNVTRYVKNPTTKVVSPQSVSVYLQTSVSIGHVTGTPSGTPTIPALPADTPTVVNIPLAAIRIVTTYAGSGSTINGVDIRDQQPILAIDRHMGVSNIQPANGNNDGAGTYSTNTATFGWTVTSGSRPALFLPPAMVGGVTRFAEFDLTSATEANWSHPPASIVDSSVDWRRRLFKVTWQINSTAQANKFGTDMTAAAISVPYAVYRPTTGSTFLSNSFTPSAQLSVGNADVLVLTHADDTTNIQAGASFGLYVDSNTGNLMLGANATSPQVRLFVWVDATEQYLGP